MILIAGGLHSDRATLTALCAGMGSLPDVAAYLQGATVEPFNGSWTDAEREARRCDGDLPAGRELYWQSPRSDLSVTSIAVATPMHAALGLTDLTPVDPSACALSVEDSHELCSVADAHMQSEGVCFQFVDAARWLVISNQDVDVKTERPDWMIGEALRPNLPRGRDARTVERWMNELQMLLYTHPVNIRREDLGLLPVNVIWLWGFSAKGDGADATVVTHAPNLRWLSAVRNGDVSAWQRAWLDVAPHLSAPSVADDIILGDHRPRLRLTPRKPTASARFTSSFRSKPKLVDVLLGLQTQ